MRLHGVVLS